MKISVVIASYNRREALAGCLTTLLDQNLPCSEYEIVVVVDGSSDGTSEMLNSFRPQCTLVTVEQENQGQTAALNAGVAAATGEIVLFLDDDLLCDRGLISAHLGAHEKGATTLVFGRMRSVLGPSSGLGDRLMHEDLETYYSRLEKDPLPKWPDDAWVGPNCSIRRAAFLAAGGYDEQLFPRRREDIELGLRLWKMGIHFRFEPKAITSHQLVKSARQVWADAEEDGASMITLCRKHPEMRLHSGLVGAMSAPAWKRHAARAVISRPAVARIALGALVAAFEKLAWLTWAQRIELRLYLARQSLATLAGARRAAGSWRLLTKLFRNPLAVLLYHHIGFPTPTTENLALTVTPKKFERQVRWLRWRGYTAITPAQWLAWHAGGEPLPRKPVLLTFDDAYADISKHALPVLERYGFRSAVFVISGQVGGVNTWDGLPVMTMRQIRHWAARGVEIGGHSRTHPDLTGISDDAVASEIAGSKEDLADAGLRPLSFAYPYGCFDDRVRKSVDGIFPLAFTCEEGLNDLRTDPLLLRRTMVQPGDTILDIELRAALGRSPLNSLRSRLRIRSRLVKALRHMRLLHH
jgi:GT2 family glycosyltransferase/peptidoglycan/xylan/chitin deacetylase (PgdA/CDA1 family)